jgi:hypothetical protein
LIHRFRLAAKQEKTITKTKNKRQRHLFYCKIESRYNVRTVTTTTTNKMPTIVWFTGPVGASVRHEVEMTAEEAQLYYMGLLSLETFVQETKKRSSPTPSNLVSVK